MCTINSSLKLDDDDDVDDEDDDDDYKDVQFQKISIIQFLQRQIDDPVPTRTVLDKMYCRTIRQFPPFKFETLSTGRRGRECWNYPPCDI